MKLKKNKARLIEIFNESGGNITKTTKAYCEEFGYEYNDSKRRTVSAFLNREHITEKAPGGKDAVTSSKWEEDHTKDSAYIEQYTSTQVKTLEELIKVCNIDLNVWEVERYLCNAWGVTSFHTERFKTGKGKNRYKDFKTPVPAVNYQVKVWLKRRVFDYDTGIKKVLETIEAYTPKPLMKVTTPSDKHIVVTMADFHIGADIKGLIRTPDFDVNVLLDYLDLCVQKINSYGARKVTLNLLGDFYESISGLNHENTFKSLGKDMWGGNVIILANEILTTHLLSKINNLVEVNMVSGNHDRMTISKRVDNTGEGAKVLWHMLKKDFPALPIEYSDSVLTKEIDGINYILTHGDKAFSKKEVSKVVFDYGNPKLFNLFMEGHYHTRKTVKALTQKMKFYEEVEVVSFDESNYRKINVASLFTGNYYSESLGFAGNAGMTISFNNGINNKPEVHDFTI